MIPIIKTKETFGMFTKKEKYLGVLQHVNSFTTNEFELKRACWLYFANTLYIIKICITDAYAMP